MPTFLPATFEKDDLAGCQGKKFITQGRWGGGRISLFACHS
jgi:hypothetical protein